MAGFIENKDLVVAKDLRYTDDNGDLVQRLLPLDYIILLGKVAAALKKTTDTSSATITDHENRITELEDQDIPDEYTTPTINGGCINGDQVEAIDTLLTSFIEQYCSFRDVTGTDNNLNGAVSIQPVQNNDAAYAGGTLGGITGWVTSPQYVADTLKNIWLTIGDIRTGLDQALAQSAVTCANVGINFAGSIVDNGQTLNIYLAGWCSIPAGFTDVNSGSTVSVMDSLGNIYTNSIDVVDGASGSDPVVFDLSASNLYFADDYTVTLTTNLTNGTITCSKVVIKTITNNTPVCPGIALVNPSTTSVAITYTPYLTDNVVYSVTIYESNGTTVIETQEEANPSSAFTKTFNNLTTATTYKIGVQVQYTGADPVDCTKTTVITD
jgi:hypothetical protein